MGSQAPESVDLVVVGGGPTGLLSAVLARQLGLSVCVLDEKPSSLPVGRADALNARTQQYLEVAGTLQELRSKGIECNTSSTFAEGVFKSRQSTWWTSLEHCHHKNFLMIGQPEVEKALLGQLDTPVRFGERVASIQEDDGGVTVTAETGRTTRAKYAIGADGARSSVRQALGIGFQGTKPEMLWAVLDTFLDTDFPVCSEIITFQLNGQSRVSWIPRERGMSRFYVLLEGDVTQEKAEASIREHLAPHRVDFVRTEWFSTFEGKQASKHLLSPVRLNPGWWWWWWWWVAMAHRAWPCWWIANPLGLITVRERIASAFVTKEGKGRIVLAGDAAHVHSVNGGQGLNTGIADAFGLIWRLALACRGDGRGADPGGVVSTYDLERRTVAQDVINVAARLVRDTMHTAKQYVATIEKNAGYITGMGVAYSELGSRLIVESERGIWKAGRRCPDLTLASQRLADDEQNRQQRLYSLARYGRFQILAIGGASNDLHAFQRFRHAADILVLASTAEEGAVGGQDDSDGSCPTYASDLVSPGDSFTVLVRPDMYIGYVGDAGGVQEYLLNLFA
ncbi:FAD monooxygenase [Apiospora rasikravindrae]|uniref:FAD monooxygenase n=1 Tax=Apiospora rasikravindrae TaxID=990691 RepID=A0ABR1TDR1_9PEZI